MGTFLRNFFAVLLGLAVALIIITFGITLNENWIEYDFKGFPYEHWRSVVYRAAKTPGVRNGFFIALLLSSGVGAIFGGLTTAIFVNRAKIAYAALVGFILFLIAMLDVFITPGHPTWYELLITPVLFFFSWLGGLIVHFVYKKFFLTEVS